MSFQNRKQIILKILEEKGEAEVKDFAQALDISEITIRRDLQQMATDGLLFRTHGGAMKLSLAQMPFTFANKTAVNAKEKDKICQLAAQQIQEGDIILMDCGSTVFRMCQFIKNKRIKVITNSLPVVYELMNSQVSINLIGGEIDQGRQAVHGRIAEEHIARYKVDKAFLGVDGISPENGLSAFGEDEASITLAMAKASARNYFLCDASKLGKDKYLTFAPITLVDVLVTNASFEDVKVYQDKGVETLCAL